MDYEKAYKDLMEKVEAVKKDTRIGLKEGTYYNGYVQTGIRDALEYITTEESDDEMIMKAIGAAICGTTAETVLEANGVKLVDALAYLEKQKDEAKRQYDLGEQAGREEVLYEMEKEQKPTQTSNEREYIRALKSIVSDFIHDKQPEDVAFYQKIYDWLEGRHIEQKPAEDKDAIEPTPKQDYSWLTDFERAIHRGFLCAGVENVPIGIIKDTAQDCLTLIEQKPAEWSEEDEKKLMAVISLMRANRAVDPFYDKMCLEGWLKSLRPQPHWKPSQEQMEELLNALNPGKDFDCDILAELYGQLKKLM